MFHMTRQMQTQMQWRPDAVTRTGVIEPMWIRQVSPVDMARHTIDPFIASVRGPGPAVSPYPSPEDVAYAAGKLAQLFARGKGGVVCLGTEKITVNPNQPPQGGIVGTITQAAQELARGGTVTIQVGARRVVVCNSGPGGEPQLKPAAPAPTAAAITTSTPANQAGVRAEAAQPATPQQTSVAVRPTPMTTEQQVKNGFGAPPVFTPPMMANTVLPKPAQAGSVPGFPYFDYAKAYRMLNYDDNVWARRNYQAKLAARFAPAPVMQMHAANRDAIRYAQTQAGVPLDTRPPMVQQRWPHPEAVWPRNTSVNVRREQR